MNRNDIEMFSFRVGRRVFAVLSLLESSEGTRALMDAAGWDGPPEGLSVRPPRLHVRALGRLGIEIDGCPLPLERNVPRIPLALLKLLMASHEPISLARVLRC